MAGEAQLPLFDMVDLGEYDPDRVRAAEYVAHTILNDGVVLLGTCSTIARDLGVTRQAISSRHLNGKMPYVHFRTAEGSPYWLPYQVAEFVELQNAEKDS